MSSSLQHRLGSNYVPSDEEIYQVRSLKASLDIHLRNLLEHNIHPLQQHLQLLSEKRSAIRDLSESYRAVLSPIRGLNQDILQNIFLACLPAGRNPCMSATEAPILLTRICSSWRATAHSIPSLWSAIHIVLPCFKFGLDVPEWKTLSVREEVKLKLEQRQAGVTEWLERSRSCPLSISVYVAVDVEGIVLEEDYDAMDRECQLHTSFITATVLPYCERWEEIDFSLSPKIFNRLLKSKAVVPHTPLLKRVHISAEGAHSVLVNQSYLQWETITGFLSSRLTHLTFLGDVAFQHSDLTRFTPPIWGHIRELNIETGRLSTQNGALNPVVSLSDIVHYIIRHCPLLESLKLIIFNLPESRNHALTPTDVESVPLPYSKSFSIQVNVLTTFQFISLTNSLHFPSLESFNIKVTQRADSWDAVEVVLRNSGRNLKEFGLYALGSPTGNDIQRINLVKLLEHTPSLKCIKLTSKTLHYTHRRWQTWSKGMKTSGGSYVNKFVNDDFLSTLSPLGKTYLDIICPQLEVLECDPGLTTGVSSSALKEFVVSRQNAHLLDDRIAYPQRVSIKPQRED